MRKGIVLGIIIWTTAIFPALAGSWSAGAPLQTGRAALGVAVLNSKIYAIGGAGILNPLSVTETYRAGMGGWRVDADLPVGLESFGLTAFGGKLYAAGGYASDTNGQPTARMWEFDPANDEWTQGPSMPFPRAGFALVAVLGKLYAFGGTGPNAEKLFVYDIDDRIWKTLEQGLTNSRDLAAIALGNKIYVIAGGPAANPVAAVHIFNTQDASWAEGPPLPLARSGHAVALLSGKIHVLGGRSSGRGMSLADHWVLDVNEGKWQAAEPLPSARTGAAAIGLNGAIYVIGGGAGGGFFAPFTAMTETDIWRPAPKP
jgi:N-acetylneuraminic acid mutarotase